MFDPVKNFIKVTVSTGYAAGATSVVLSTGEGAKLPAPATDGEFNMVWYDATDYKDPSLDPNVEIVRVTGISSDTLTVTRAQEGTADSAKNTAEHTYQMILSFTKKTYDDMVNAINLRVVKSTNGNAIIQNFNGDYTTTATAADTTTLTAASTYLQTFTGSTTQTIVLPVVSTFTQTGTQYLIKNLSTGALTVNSSGGNLVATIQGGTSCIVTCIALTGTTAASWEILRLNTLSSDSVYANTIELGNASDTTLARVSGGVVSIEGNNILVNGGALGTPLSGTVTNLTGTASININGTVGATTPTTGKFTTVSADHIAENTGAHTIVFDNTITNAGQSDLTTVHSTTHLVDHIGEHTGSHTIVADNTITTATGAGIILPAGGGIKLTLPTTNAQCTGNYTDSFQSGYTAAAGDLVFYGSGGKWLEVDADAVATCKGLIGIAMEAKNDGQAMKVALPGSMVHFDAWNWTTGDTLYAGETLGAIQNAIPTGADAIIKVVGFAIDADTIYFNPSPDQQSTVA